MSKNEILFSEEILQKARMIARLELHPEIIPPGDIEKYIGKTKDIVWRLVVEHEKKKLIF